MKGFEEPVGFRRPLGAKHGHGKHRTSWKEEREAEERTLGVTEQPYAVIIGGGQGAMALGARLKMLQVPTIILEKNERPGDSYAPTFVYHGFRYIRVDLEASAAGLELALGDLSVHGLYMHSDIERHGQVSFVGASAEGAVLDAFEAYLAEAPEITGQYLEGDGQGAGDPAQ